MAVSLKYLDSGGQEDKSSCKNCCCRKSDYLTDRILDAMQTGVIFFDADGIICRINALARKDLHLAEDVEGHTLFDLLAAVRYNENILPDLIGHLKTAKADQVRLPSDVFLRYNEKKVQFFASGYITRLESGCYLLSFRNITDEITREQILSMALTRTKIFPWFYDMERNKMLIDAHWFSYLGIPAGDCTMLSEEFFDRVHPDERFMLSEALRKQLTDEEVSDSFAYRLRRGDGTWEWFSEQSVYLGQTDDGSPYRVVGVCQSIQDHKIIEENLRAARDKAQESDRLKSAFLADMSHEIRTPLNAIVGFSNLLTGGDIDINSDEGREYAVLISKNCDFLLTLVSDILDLSRIETGTMEYSFAEHSLRQFLSDVYRNHKDRMTEGVEFNLLLPPGDIRIVTDTLRLRQVLDNLLSNAIKFTGKGHIDLGYTQSGDGKSVRLFVADTGRGIPADQFEKIFDRFYKISTFVQGAGLGLSICKTLTERLGGTISVSSRPGEGSRFTLRLPLCRQDNVSLATS